jgi:hypothetical protein
MVVVMRMDEIMDGFDGPLAYRAVYGKRMGRAQLPMQNCNSADARDGILLPVVVHYTGLRFRL